MSTCTAPGHPTCTVTCPQGCVALYDEKEKKCKTHCGPSATALGLTELSRFSICINGVTGPAAMQVFGGCLPKAVADLLSTYPGTLSLSLANADIHGLAAELERLASR